MDSVEFNYVPIGGGYVSSTFDALAVVPDYSLEETKYSDINDNLRNIVEVAHKRWAITFGMLTDTQQDWFLAMQAGSSVHFIYNTVTYNIVVEGMNIRHIGSKVTIIKLEAE